MRAQLKLYAKRLALVLGTLVLLALLGEGAVRLFTDTPPALLVRDPVVGRRYVRSWEGGVYSAEADREILLRFNSHGFRDPERPIDKPAGVHRLALLGDSMVAALEVDEADTLARRLEGMLRRSHPDMKWEVQNWGVSGSDLAQELVLYQGLVRRFSPDLVLLCYYVGNDFPVTYRPVWFDVDAQGELHAVPRSATRAHFSSWLNRSSRLYRWWKLRRVQARAARLKRKRGYAPGFEVFRKNLTPQLAEGWRLTEAFLRTWRREVEGGGARLALISIPALQQVHEDAWSSDILRPAGEQGPHFDADYPDERLSALCKAEAIAFFSLLPDFRAALPGVSPAAERNRLYWAHLNERGHLLAAQTIHRFLTTGPLFAGPVGEGR